MLKRGKYQFYLAGPYNMAINPTKFSIMTVTDTCSVWNVLSSRKLYQASITAKVHFCITPMVLYECLYKPRSSMTAEKNELIVRLEKARKENAFPILECSLEDLAELALRAPSGLGSGEMSCMAMAYKIRSAFMTDEKKARKFAEKKLALVVETTPKLYGWLHYNMYLNDGDHMDVISEHEHHESMPLTRFFSEAFETAMHYRVMISLYSNALPSNMSDK
jgi:predicted nucleic acid-binding protein